MWAALARVVPEGSETPLDRAGSCPERCRPCGTAIRVGPYADVDHRQRGGRTMTGAPYGWSEIDPSYPEPTTDVPSIEQLEFYLYDGVSEATDGCSVEPDGCCTHGHPSWILILGSI